MTLSSEEKLSWLGVRATGSSRSAAADDVELLKQEYEEYSEWQSAVDDWEGFDDLEDGLVDAGYSEGDAKDLRDRIERNFGGWSSYESYVTDETDSWESYKGEFGQETGIVSDRKTEDGAPTTGFKIHEEDGTSEAGVEVPAGTVEIFGPHIEVSQTDPPRKRAESLEYGDISTDKSDDVATINQTVTFSCDVTNPNGYQIQNTVPLLEDGDVVDEKRLTFEKNETRTVEFEVTKPDYVCYDYQIGGSDEVVVCWAPAGLDTGGG